MATMKLATSTTMSVTRIARLCMCFSSSARSMTLHTVAPKAAFCDCQRKEQTAAWIRGFAIDSRLRNPDRAEKWPSHTSGPKAGGQGVQWKATLTGPVARGKRYENAKFKVTNKIPVMKSKTLNAIPTDSIALI